MKLQSFITVKSMAQKGGLQPSYWLAINSNLTDRTPAEGHFMSGVRREGWDG